MVRTLTTRCIAAAALLAFCGCPKFGALLRQYGYAELKPPSQLMEPGAVVFIENKRPFQAGVICNQAMSLGKGFKPVNSPTSNSTLNKAANVKMDIGADVLNLVQGKADVSAIRTIKVELHNPVIYTLTDLDVLRGAQERDPLCSQAIMARLNAGFAVTMITRALMADVTYSVTWKQESHLDAKARIEALSGLAPHLGVAQGSVRESSIVGKNLFWGVMDETYLFKLSMQGLVGGMSGASGGGLASENPEEAGSLIPAEQDEAVLVHPTVDVDGSESGDDGLDD